MKKGARHTDCRPRFGWVREDWIDNDPQTVWESRKRGGFVLKDPLPVVVIPLPQMNPKVQAKVRAYVNNVLWA